MSAKLVFSSLVGMILAMLVLFGISHANPLDGAIFTTIVDGSRVNANIYDDKDDVYLNGGPGPNAPCDSAGLPDGEYYFQVTDPSGAVLLSTDAVEERKVLVESGITTTYLGTTHSTGTGPCDALTVQLMPYDDTPNNGGEYKAWMTPVADYDLDDPQSNFGFVESSSKTDNYKVRESMELGSVEVCKYHDLNGSGAQDEGEPPLSGWQITVFNVLDTEVAEGQTGQDGCVTFDDLLVGENPHQVQETLVENWWNSDPGPLCDLSTCPTPSKSLDVPANDTTTVIFGNLELGEIHGLKWSDENSDGVKDESELGLAGITINLSGPTSDSTVTDENGEYAFTDLLPGDYTVCEVLPVDDPPFTQTYPGEENDGCHVVSLEDGEVISNVNFGNVQLAELSGHVWEDSNGDALHDGGEPESAGITVHLVCGDQELMTITDENGYYAFEDLTPCSGQICIDLPQTLVDEPEFNQTFPAGCLDIVLGAGDQVTDQDFGILQLAEIHGLKWNDLNGDGIHDEGENTVEGVTIQLKDGEEVLQETETDENGEYAFLELMPGTYLVCEVLPETVPPTVQTYPGDNACHEVIVESGAVIENQDFGNVQTAEKHGIKFYDTNMNGIQDGGEVGILGWKINLNGDVSSTSFTDGTGAYAFTNLLPGSYSVTEVLPNASWSATTPLTINFSLETGEIEENNNFGNICLGGGNAHTIGFWGNKNGQALFTAPDLALMVSLNLRNANGTHFNPVSYSAYKAWLQKANATNMSYMLSAQLSATQLNVFNGLVSGGNLVYAPGILSANGLGFVTLTDLINEANTELGLHGLVNTSGATRIYQEALKNALDRANNNLNFLSPTPCSFSYPQ